jgi:hypothetical protein
VQHFLFKEEFLEPTLSRLSIKDLPKEEFETLGSKSLDTQS